MRFPVTHNSTNYTDVKEIETIQLTADTAKFIAELDDAWQIAAAGTGVV